MEIKTTDTASYPNLILTTITDDSGVTIRHELNPVDGYLIHNHKQCSKGNKEHGIPAECRYFKTVLLAPSFDLSTINTTFEAVEEK